MDKGFNIEIDIKKPTNEELESLIKPLIPEPLNGKDGVDGITPSKEEIVSLIKPLIPTPLKGQDGKSPTKKELKELIKPLIPKVKNGVDGKNGKDGVSPTIEEIKTTVLNVEIDYKNIKNVPDIDKIVRITANSSKTNSLKELDDVDLSQATITNGKYVIGSGGGGGAVDSVNGHIGIVVLDKTDIGLSNVDNTTDLLKPISTATQTALDAKQDILSEGAFVNGDKTKLNTYSEANQTTNNAKISYTDATKVAHITVTQAVNLDTIESDTATNNAKISFDATSSGKLAGIEALAEVNNISDVNADDLVNGSDSTLHFHASDRDRANGTGTQLSSTISDFNSATDSRVDSGIATHVALSDPHNQYQKESERDTANGYVGLDAGGKINPSQLPAIAISETFVVATQVAMLAVTAQTGDIAIRTDLSKTFILQGTDPTVLADWVEMLTPTDAVTSVFGRIGVVTAQANDYTFAQLATKPTTISGYGISDAETTAQLNARDTANRDRANATGTQLATTISDFASAVSGNSAVTANTAKITYPSADATKVGHITVTQAVNLDTIESDTATNNAKVSNANHTGEVTGSTTLTIADNAVVSARIADNAVTNTKISGAGTRDATTFYRGDGTFATPTGVVEGYTTTATAAGTTTLTVASNRQQFFTGSTTQTVTLPVASTLVLGQNFLVRNLSTGIVTVNSSGANVVLAIPSVTTAVFTCILVSGTTAASWSVSSYLNTPVVAGVNPSVDVYNTTNQSVLNSTTTLLTWNSENWDSEAIHSTSVNTGRLTCVTEGKYIVTTNLIFSSNNTGVRQIVIDKNGAQVWSQIFPQNNAGEDQIGTVFVLALAVNDYVTCSVWHGAGVTLTVAGSGRSTFGMHKLSS